MSEDIFTGFDTIIKGGKSIHVEYHEVGKARDVDLYTTTKFTRKISMGASQMACSRFFLLNENINMLDIYSSYIPLGISHFFKDCRSTILLLGSTLIICYCT